MSNVRAATIMIRKTVKVSRNATETVLMQSYHSSFYVL